MNHHRSPGGYHSLVVGGIASLAALWACVPPPPALPPQAPSPGAIGQPWAAERAAVVAHINIARRELGLDPLVYDATLERVGDTHCRILIAEDGAGHFSRCGIPPYLRVLLAGGHGFHRENVASYSSTRTVDDAQMSAILLHGVEAMLAEVPPEDGHRRSLLDPWVTHIGVGVARAGGEVRMAHELATEATLEWTAPPIAARPRTAVELAGKLARPWQLTAVEVLWEELPRPLTDAQAAAIRSYRYPPRRSMLAANSPPPDGAGQKGAAPFATDRFGNFTFRWSTGPHEGVEIVVLWARYNANQEMVPVAASATVVTLSGTLPPELETWRELAPGSGPR